ncbi:response regulator [Duganella violaceipulchra]|uniref:Response regulator n=1 Tax=Duganella violaceipulchra TaxID=2849652 RepID=A0AA41L4P8_9BURK|nr:response regulator [Duganella violaceicalia]MBV6321237.1 response regulator [Duganella violaceicalia]MCP2009515.1 two-component system cell cycle response regulator DivK [Duganella violaceicalia]
MATILIVEDNPSNMLLATFLLEHAGHLVLQADEADSALRLARERLPDLILMDVQLPGMDGLEATGTLKGDARTGAIKVLAFTSFAMAGDADRIRAAGCDGYISKPISVDEFVALVEAALGGG